MRQSNRLVSRHFGWRVLSSAILAWAGVAQAQQAALTVHVDQPGPAIAPTFYGIMTEEINHSYDGGLYADLIQNRIFEQIPFVAAPARGAPATQNAPKPDFMMCWSTIQSDGSAGSMAIDTDNPVNNGALKHSHRLDIASVKSGGRVGIANTGYWGIPVRPTTDYRASFYTRASAGFTGPLTATIESKDGRTTYATATIATVGSEWRKQSLTLHTGQVQPTADTRFVISAGSAGAVWLSLVSLMPPGYKGLPFRNDLMEKLVDLGPAFLRFPGGAYVAGQTVEQRWAWKTTIGPAEQRTGHMNGQWGYWSSDGMGMLEFLLWCEAMKAEPVLVLHTGSVTNRRNLTAGPELDSYVQEGLDAIEYVTGDASSKWGAERAKDGHPAPFALQYVEIGNEEERGGAQTYPQRFVPFYDAIHPKYPNLKIISGMQRAAPNMAMPRHPDVVDDHYYFNTIAQALTTAHSYDADRYDRSNPKIFIGEYATRLPRTGETCNMQAACGDAAFLIGLERNADVVIMTTYAPLFTNINPGGSRWQVDLIGYDTLNSFVSPSYHVQKMFIENRGDTVLASQLSNAPKLDTQPNAPEAVVAGASRIASSGDIVLKLVNVLEAPQTIQIELQGIDRIVGDAAIEVISGAAADVNTITAPNKLR